MIELKTLLCFLQVYWGDGCQIIPPHDSGIAKAIEANLEPWMISSKEASSTPDIKTLRSNPLCSDPTEAVAKAYFEQAAKSLCRHKDSNAATPVRVAFTAMYVAAIHAIAPGRFRL